MGLAVAQARKLPHNAHPREVPGRGVLVYVDPRRVSCSGYDPDRKTRGRTSFFQNAAPQISRARSGSSRETPSVAGGDETRCKTKYLSRQGGDGSGIMWNHTKIPGPPLGQQRQGFPSHQSILRLLLCHLSAKAGTAERGFICQKARKGSQSFVENTRAPNSY